MGGLPSVATNFDPIAQGWRMTQGQQGVSIWTHPQTKQQIEEHHFIVGDASQLTQEQKTFKLRYNSDYLVAGKYFRDYSQKEVCSQMHKGNLFIERIPHRLSQVKDIPYPDVLHVYRQAIRGFNILQQSVQPFDINEQMICFNNEGKVKVWLNSKLSRGLPDLRFDGSSATEAGMVRRLIDLIETNSSYDESLSIKSFLQERAVRSFTAAQIALEQFLRIQQIATPQKMQCLSQPQNIAKLASVSNKIIQRVTKVPQIPINQSFNKAGIYTKQAQSNLNILSQTQNSLNIIKSHRPLSSTLLYKNLSQKTLNHSTHRKQVKYMNHSQSLLNILPEKKKHISYNQINPKDRIRNTTQSLLNIQSSKPVSSFHTQRLINNSKLYPKKLDTYREINQHRPLQFKSIPTKIQNIDRQIIQTNKINQRRNTNENKLIKSNFITTQNRPISSIINQKTTNNTNNTPLNKLPFSNVKDMIGKKYNSIKRADPRIHQFARLKTQSKQKDTEVYQQKQQRTIRHNTEANIVLSTIPIQKSQKISFAPKHVNYNQNNQPTYKSNAHFNQNVKLYHTPEIIKQQDTIYNQTFPIPQLTTQSLKIQNVTQSIQNSQVPMSLKSKYFIPSLSIQPFKYNQSIQQIESQVPHSYNPVTFSFGNNTSNTYRTIQQERQSITQSRGTPQINYQTTIDFQLMGDLQRMRMNILRTTPLPI